MEHRLAIDKFLSFTKLSYQDGISIADEYETERNII
jgi:hypothetical protein